MTATEEPTAAQLRKEQHNKFIVLWHEAYLNHFGIKYVMSGGKDGSAIKRLLSASGLSAEELMDGAKAAWGRASWPCRQAVTICGFASQFNAINRDLILYGKGIDPERSAAAQIHETRTELDNLHRQYSGIERVPTADSLRIEKLIKRLEALQSFTR